MTPERLAGIYAAGAIATAIVVAQAIDRHNMSRRRLRDLQRIHTTEHVMLVFFSALFWPFVAFLFVVVMGEGDD